MNGFSKRLKIALKAAGYTQKKATEKLNLSKNALTNYVKGRIPDTLILYKLSKLLDVSMEWLLDGEDYPSKNISLSSSNKNTMTCDTIEADPLADSYGHTNNLMELTEDEHNLIHKYRQLSKNDKEEIEAILNMKFDRIALKKGTSFTSQNGKKETTKELA